MPVALVTQSRAHKMSERGRDLYETPPEAVQALLEVEPSMPHRVWEPACGRYAIANVLVASGFHVTATDISISKGQDFFLYRKRLAPAIITNPPGYCAAQFVAHALRLGTPYVAVLLRWAFWEGGTGDLPMHRARRFVLDEVPPRRAYCFANRLPMMHRDGWKGPKASSSIAFGWFVWDRILPPGDTWRAQDGTTIKRIRWRPRADNSQKPVARSS